MLHPAYFYKDTFIHNAVTRLGLSRGAADLWQNIDRYQMERNLGTTYVPGGFSTIPYPPTFYTLALVLSLVSARWFAQPDFDYWNRLVAAGRERSSDASHFPHSSEPLAQRARGDLRLPAAPFLAARLRLPRASRLPGHVGEARRSCGHRLLCPSCRPLRQVSLLAITPRRPRFAYVPRELEQFRNTDWPVRRDSVGPAAVADRVRGCHGRTRRPRPGHISSSTAIS